MEQSARWPPPGNWAERDQGLELQVIFNKGAVMILPAGVNKASGLIAALKEMNISPHNVVGIGDAENDHAFLRMCEMCVAVANALPAVKDMADLVTAGDHSQGVCQVIEELVANDLADAHLRLQRHHLELGTCDEQEVMLSTYGQNVLICGPSVSGRSTVATRIVEYLAGGPFFEANRPGVKVSQGVIDSFWLQGMRAGHKNTFDCIKAFSETDFAEDLKSSTHDTDYAQPYS